MDPLFAIAAADNSGADLNVFMCKDPKMHGNVGSVGILGSMCKTYWPGLNSGINEKRYNVLSTSALVAHEMGHSMGMSHDHDPIHGGDNGPCNGQGIMSYGSHPNVWSTCSRNDFLALYNEIVTEKKVSWCLDGMFSWEAIFQLRLRIFENNPTFSLNRLSQRLWCNSSRTTS